MSEEALRDLKTRVDRLERLPDDMQMLVSRLATTQENLNSRLQAAQDRIVDVEKVIGIAEERRNYTQIQFAAINKKLDHLEESRESDNKTARMLRDAEMTEQRADQKKIIFSMIGVVVSVVSGLVIFLLKTGLQNVQG